MNTIKAYFKERGLYLFCLALVFGATVIGILAIRNVVRNVADWAEGQNRVIEEENPWNQPNALANEPATDVPEPTREPQPTSTPAASSSAAPSSSGALSQDSDGLDSSGDITASSNSSGGSQPVSGPVEGGTVSVPFSHDELVYHETLGDWRTHNGTDYTAKAGTAVVAVRSGTVAAAYDDALWGGVVEVAAGDGTIWRYCGLEGSTVQRGDTVNAGTKLGTVATPPAEADGGAHLHLECTKDGSYLDPAA